MRSVDVQQRADRDRIDRERYLSQLFKQKLAEGVKNSELRLKYNSLLGQIKQSWESGHLDLAQELLGKLPPGGDRGFEFRYLERLVTGVLSRFEAHTEPVTCLAVGEGKLMASGDRAGLVIAWDMPKGLPHRSQGRHDHAIRHVAVSEGGAGGGPGVVASASVREDGSIDLKLWDAASGSPLHSSRQERLVELNLAFSNAGDLFMLLGVAPETRRIRCLRWRLGPSGWTPLDASVALEGSQWSASPDGRLLALGRDDGSIRLERSEGESAPDLEQSGGAKTVSIRFSKDSSRLLAGREDGSMTLWDTRDGRVLARDDGTGKPAFVLDLRNNSSEAIGSDETGTIWVRKLGHSSPHCSLPAVSGHIGSVVLSRDGGLLAAEIDQRRVIVWKLTTGESLGSFLSTCGPIHRIAFADDQSLIIGSEDPAIRLWRFRSSDDLADPLPGHRAAVLALAFSPDDQLLASGAEDNAIKLWRVEDGRELGTLNAHEGAVTSLVFLADGRLISAGLDGRTILWELTRGPSDADSFSAKPETIRRGDEPCLSLGVPTLPEVAEVAVGGASGSIWILDLVTRKLKIKMKKHSAGVRSIVYCGQNALASASMDGTVRIWDVHSKTPYTTSRFTAPMRAIAILPEGEELAATGDGREVILWSIDSVERKMTFSAHPLPSRCIAFPQIGRMLATACDDGRIRLWDTAAGLQIYSLNGHNRPINAIAFTGDGYTLASADDAGRINLWRSATAGR